MKKYSLQFHIKATSDLQEIELYYDEISVKITKNFFEALSETLNFIEQDPNLFQERYKQIRIATLNKFPYGIHYKITNNNINILRIIHF